MHTTEEQHRSLARAIGERHDICCSLRLKGMPPAHLTSPVFLDYTGIIICISGWIDFCVNGQRQRLSKGETLFLSENIQFHISAVSDDVEYSLVFYRIEPIRAILGNAVMIMRLFSTLNPQSIYILPTENQEKLEAYIQLLSAYPRPHGDIFAEDEKRLLLMGLTYCLCSIFSNRFIKDKDLGGRNKAVFIRLVELISANFSRERSVAFYADKLCLSPKYLSTMVKKTCGYTVQDLIFKAITRRSIYLLTATNKPIQAIASEMNFPNASSFGTFFKKQTGVSPKHYRDSESTASSGKG